MENAYTASDHGGGGKDHTEYALTVTVHATNDKWSITKRYRCAGTAAGCRVRRRLIPASSARPVPQPRRSEFAQLHDRLRAISFAGVKRLSLPPKRLFDNLAEGVITQRKQALEQYLNAVLSHAHSLRDVPPLRFFLQCPERLVRAAAQGSVMSRHPFLHCRQWCCRHPCQLPYTEREHPSKGGRAGATASSPAAASDSGSGVVMPLRPTGLVSLADAARMYPEYQRRRR